MWSDQRPTSTTEFLILKNVPCIHVFLYFFGIRSVYHVTHTVLRIWNNYIIIFEKKKGIKWEIVLLHELLCSVLLGFLLVVVLRGLEGYEGRVLQEFGLGYTELLLALWKPDVWDELPDAKEHNSCHVLFTQTCFKSFKLGTVRFLVRGYWSEVVTQVGRYYLVCNVYLHCMCTHMYAWWCTHVCSGRVKGWCCSRLMGFCCGWVQGHWGSSHQIPIDAGCSSGHALQIYTHTQNHVCEPPITHTQNIDRKILAGRKMIFWAQAKKSHWGKRFFLEDSPYCFKHMFCTFILSFLSVSYIFSPDWIKLRATEKYAFLKTKHNTRLWSLQQKSKHWDLLWKCVCVRERRH